LLGVLFYYFFIFICLFVSTDICSCDSCSLRLEGEQVVNIQEQDFQGAATTKRYRRQVSLIILISHLSLITYRMHVSLLIRTW